MNDGDCLDCKHCKINISKKILRCKRGHWLKANEDEKILKLNHTEASTLHITWRNIFAQGRKCYDLKSSWDET